MYKCKKCEDESEFPGECCEEAMVCSTCQGAGCTICEEDKQFE